MNGRTFMRAVRWACLVGWLLCAAGAARAAAGERPAASQAYLVIVDTNTYADAGLQRELATYFQHVAALFDFAPRVETVRPFDPAAPGAEIASIRELIRSLDHYE